MAKKPNGSSPVNLRPYTAQLSLIKSGINTDWSHKYYGIEELHKLGKRGKGIKVGVLDTGIDLTHSSFAKALREGRLKSVDVRKGKSNPVCRNGHGTFCASRFISDNEEVLGFAPDCTLVSIKVLGDNGSGVLGDIKRGLEYALREGVHIVSLSLGYPNRWAPLDALIKEYEEKGILILSAAGNDGTEEGIDWPAMYPYAISVGSHDKNGKRSSFSDFGVDLDIYSSGGNVKGAWIDNAEVFISGTSMATPSLGGILTCLYNDIKEKFEIINRDTLKKLVTCQ